jgi:predicted amidophosphoribosyltransferase
MSETKNCPFCAEAIKAEAIICKHCGKEVNKPLSQQVIKEEEKKIVVEQKSSNLVTILIVLAIIALCAYLFGA